MMENNNTLDVTVLEPRLKHPTIFARFDALNPGESLTIHNDHDPKPLYYQLLAERGSIFTWEYEGKGPEWWIVRISKKKSGEKEETLGELAVKDLRKAAVFKKYGLDFCCGGKKTVKEACMEKGLDITRIEEALQEVDRTKLPGQPLAYDEWDLSFLIDYILNTHHAYVKKALPELMKYMTKVAGVHGQNHPELLVIKELLGEVNKELSAHLFKEERVLFPYIKELISAESGLRQPIASQFGTVQNPINMMEMEHELVGKNFEEIRSLSKDYTLPEDACTSYRVLYKSLEAFENDLHMHIHLENNIVFPKALLLEKK